MDIDFNGRFLGRTPTGVDRFARETLLALDQLLVAEPGLSQGRRFRLLVPTGVCDLMQLQCIEWTPVGRWQGLIWEQLELPWHARGRRLVSLCNAAPIVLCDQLVVIHDAATRRVPASFGRGFRAWYQIMIPILYRRARVVATVSEFARVDLAAVYGQRADVVVLSEGTDHMGRIESDMTVLQRKDLGKKPYVLGVSSLTYHKNFKLIVDALPALQDLEVDVVVAGMINPVVFANAALPPQVRHVGYVSDGELKALFENAACFVFPSLYEGYGLPPTEAMACGCPVVCSSAASMPEVCGDSAVYFDPSDASGLAAAVRSVLQSKDFARALSAKGYLRSAVMRWNLTARALLTALDAAK